MWRANGASDLPLADRAMAWDANAADRRVREWAGGDAIDWERYRKAFFAYDDERTEEFGGYKLLFADVVDGELRAVPRGIMAVAAALQGSRGGVDLPEDVQADIRKRVGAYYAKWDEVAPWDRKSAPVVREGRVLSERNRQLIANAIQQTREAVDALQELLDSTALPEEERRAIVDELRSVRALPDGRLGGYAIVWGGRDLYDTYFTPETDTWRDRLPNPPLLYDHGFNEAIGATPLGQIVVRRIDDIGEWVEAELERHSEYLEAIKELLRRDKQSLGWSTASARHLVEIEDDGCIRRWPVVEVSLTPTPAEPRTLGVEELRALHLDAYLAGAVEIAATDGEAAETEEALILERNKTEGETKMGTDIEKRTEELQQEEQGVEARGAYAVPAVLKAARGDDATKAFVHWARTGDEGAVRTAVVWEEGTGTSGGVLVPEDLYNQVVKKLQEKSVARAMGAGVYNTSRDVVRIPVLAPLANYALTAESGSYSETEVTPFAEVAVTVYKYTRLVKVSEELLDDSVFNVAQVLMGAFADAQAQTENALFIAGSGSNQPQGILYGGTLGVTLASKDAITAAEVQDAYWSLSSLYRQDRDRVAWVMQDSTEKAIRKLQATSSAGEFLFQATPAGQIADNLLGYRVFNTIAAQAMGTLSNRVIGFGNWAYYTIVQNKGLVVTRDPYTSLATGQVRFAARFRIGGAVTESTAFIYVKCPAS